MSPKTILCAELCASGKECPQDGEGLQVLLLRWVVVFLVLTSAFWACGRSVLASGDSGAQLNGQGAD